MGQQSQAGETSTRLKMGLVREASLDVASAKSILATSAETLSLAFEGKPISTWSHRRGSLQVIDAKTSSEVIANNLLFRGQDPAATHLISLQAGMQPRVPDGSLKLSVGRQARDSAELSLNLPTGMIDPIALRELFERFVQLWQAQRAWLGPVAAATRRIGWLTFINRPAPQLRKPARSEARFGGAILVAHESSPESESPEALQGYEAVELFLRAGDTGSNTQKANAERRMELPPAIVASPTTTNRLATSLPEVLPRAVSPDETLPIPSPYRVEPSSLPFSGSTTPQRLAELKASAATTPALEHGDETNETLMIRSPLVAAPSANAPFAQQISPIAIPLLSLDEYAKFRALLRVHGEEHSPTWLRFGILSQAAKDAVQLRFAQHFQRDAQAQREFVSQVENYVKDHKESR